MNEGLLGKDIDASRKGLSEALAKFPPMSRLSVPGIESVIPFETTPREKRMLNQCE